MLKNSCILLHAMETKQKINVRMNVGEISGALAAVFTSQVFLNVCLPFGAGQVAHSEFNPFICGLKQIKTNKQTKLKEAKKLQDCVLILGDITSLCTSNFFT